MARVSKESLEKLNAFIDSLPPEARNKCALCTETLTHLGMTAQIKTGAPLATFARTMAEKINKTAAPGDRVKPESLRAKIRYTEDPSIWQNSPNNPQPQHDPPDGKEDEKPVVENKPFLQIENWREHSGYEPALTTEDEEIIDDAFSSAVAKKTTSKGDLSYLDYDIGSLPMRYARMAVLDLEKIENSHPDRNKAFDFVIEWINNARR